MEQNKLLEQLEALQAEQKKLNENPKGNWLRLAQIALEIIYLLIKLKWQK
jgi:hypothetical protein